MAEAPPEPQHRPISDAEYLATVLRLLRPSDYALDGECAIDRSMPPFPLSHQDVRSKQLNLRTDERSAVVENLARALVTYDFSNCLKTYGIDEVLGRPVRRCLARRGVSDAGDHVSNMPAGEE